jgi:hypothetical protein
MYHAHSLHRACSSRSPSPVHCNASWVNDRQRSRQAAAAPAARPAVLLKPHFGADVKPYRAIATSACAMAERYVLAISAVNALISSAQNSARSSTQDHSNFSACFVQLRKYGESCPAAFPQRIESCAVYLVIYSSYITPEFRIYCILSQLMINGVHVACSRPIEFLRQLLIDIPANLIKTSITLQPVSEAAFRTVDCTKTDHGTEF